MPMVQHGPWVRGGTSGGLMVGAARTSDARGQDIPATLLGFDGGIRTGWVPEDSGKAAFAAGVQTSLWAVLLAAGAESPSQIAQLVMVDAYTSLPLLSGLATSAGVSASYNHALPYVQFGSKLPGKTAWYSTQALLLIPDEDLWLWLPSIAHVDRDRRPRATHFTIGAGAGRRRGEAFYMFTIGVYMEFFKADARVR